MQACSVAFGAFCAGEDFLSSKHLHLLISSAETNWMDAQVSESARNRCCHTATEFETDGCFKLMAYISIVLKLQEKTPTFGFYAICFLPPFFLIFHCPPALSPSLSLHCVLLFVGQLVQLRVNMWSMLVGTAVLYTPARCLCMKQSCFICDSVTQLKNMDWICLRCHSFLPQHISIWVFHQWIARKQTHLNYLAKWWILITRLPRSSLKNLSSLQKWWLYTLECARIISIFAIK